MALWDDFSKKVADTKDRTVQQAKVLSETQKLNALIAEEKRKIEVCYRELGLQYAQLHHDDYEAALAGAMEAILTSEKLIQDTQRKIRDMKGIRCCEKCGAELVRDAVFCCSCGAMVPKPMTSAIRCCTGCGAPLGDGVRFCTACGTPVLKAEHAVQVSAAEDYFDDYPVSEVPRCPQCNAVLEKGMEFCTGCGCRMV